MQKKYKSEIRFYTESLGILVIIVNDKLVEIPGVKNNWVKLKGDQGWRNVKDNTIWKKDKLHGDHGDVMDKKAKKFDLMDRNTKTKNLKNFPYSQYQNTEEWIIISCLLAELENNQDIELKTAPEYVIGYLVEKLRNKDLLLGKEKTKIIAQKIQENANWQLITKSKGKNKVKIL